MLNHMTGKKKIFFKKYKKQTKAVIKLSISSLHLLKCFFKHLGLFSPPEG